MTARLLAWATFIGIALLLIGHWRRDFLSAPVRVELEKYADGGLRKEDRYDAEGRRHGECRWWDSEGNLGGWSMWDHGSVIHRKRYAQDGQLIQEEREGRNFQLEVVFDAQFGQGKRDRAPEEVSP